MQLVIVSAASMRAIRLLYRAKMWNNTRGHIVEYSVCKCVCVEFCLSIWFGLSSLYNKTWMELFESFKAVWNTFEDALMPQLLTINWQFHSILKIISDHIRSYRATNTVYMLTIKVNNKYIYVHGIVGFAFAFVFTCSLSLRSASHIFRSVAVPYGSQKIEANGYETKRNNPIQP